MNNPWEEIKLSDYESHMSLESVFQLQTMNQMMKEQFYTYPVKSVMILGIAGGNGLEHINRQVLERVYGVDINENYLSVCIKRYPELQPVLKTIHADLIEETTLLPYADLLIANLLIEYIGYECFQKTVVQVKPKYISCIIQMDTNDSFVSDSPYIHVFDRLNEIHRQMEEGALEDAMLQIGYKREMRSEKDLPNGKKLVRMDFKH